MDSEAVKESLYNSYEDEYDYDGDLGSINAHKTSETSAEIGHFVVKKSERRNGYGTILLESLLEVLQDEGIRYVTVEIQALEDGSENDPVMSFLREFGFTHEDAFDHYNWGRCVRAAGHI